MTGVHGEGRLNRLEDYVELAKQGTEVRVEVDLRRELVERRFQPQEPDHPTRGRSVYLLVGDYSCDAEGETTRISKVYVFGSPEESVAAGREKRTIANARLKADYQRLKNANIRFEEEYF